MPPLRVGLFLVALAACGEQDRSPPDGRLRLVFRHQPMWGDPGPFRALLDRFRAENPGIDVVTQTIPSASDLAHQFFLTALEGRDDSFDVFVVDVIWVPEFARAGWLADLSGAFPPERVARQFFPGPVEAVVLQGRTWAIPWFVDVGILYVRADLVERPPATYDELADSIRTTLARTPGLHGYVWQGRQYEGLSCNVFEAIWGHGGDVLADGRLVLNTAVSRRALAWLRGLIEQGLSPPVVAAYAEEETRRVFQAGRAVFMRNWPYAWAELNSPGSPVRGKIEVAPLPTVDGTPGHGALGGWQLALNAFAPAAHRQAAERLIAHLTSPEANLMMALHYARLPPRPAVFEDPRLGAAAPFMRRLAPMLATARPRPVTPYYNLLADTLQSEFSGAITGLRAPAQALQRAQAQVDRLMGAAP